MSADLQAARLEVHVRGERVAELEKLLSKANERRGQLHRVHERTVDKLDAANRTIHELRRELGSTRNDRTTGKLDTTERTIQDLKHELGSACNQHARAEDSLQGALDKCRVLNAEHDQLCRDRDTAVQNLQQAQSQLSQHEAEIASVGRNRQDRDASTAQVTQLTAQVTQLTHDRDMAIKKRDEAIREGQKYYDSCRDLLVQISDIQQTYRSVRQDFDQLQDRHATLQKGHQDLLEDHTSVIGERDSTLDNLASIASAPLRSTSVARGERSASVTSSVRSSIKRPLSPSSSSREHDPSLLKKVRRSSSPVTPDPGAPEPDLAQPNDAAESMTIPAACPTAEDADEYYEFPGSDPESSEDGSDTGSVRSEAGSDHADQDTHTGSVRSEAGSDHADQDTPPSKETLAGSGARSNQTDSKPHSSGVGSAGSEASPGQAGQAPQPSIASDDSDAIFDVSDDESLVI